MNKIIPFNKPYLNQNGINAVSHYLSLNKSPYHLKNNPIIHLKNSDKFSDTLLRLPLYYELKITEVHRICKLIKLFYNKVSEKN